MLFNLDLHPEEKEFAVDQQGARLSYALLKQFARKTFKVHRGVVFFPIHNSVGAVAWLIRLFQQGLVPLFIDEKISADKQRELIEKYKIPYILLAKESRKKDIYPLEEATILEEDFSHIFFILPHEKSPNSSLLHPELSHLLSTSGSTGSPKLVRHFYRQIEAAALSTATAFELRPEDKAMLNLPLFYTMGLSVLFSHLQIGASIILSQDSLTSSDFWQLLKNEKATSFTGVPYSYYILKMLRFDRMDLPSLKVLSQGGGKMDSSLSSYFLNYCEKKNIKWYASYGQTEACARMALLPPHFALSKQGSIGKAIPNGVLFLKNEKGELISTPHQQGELYYKGPNVSSGYAFSLADLQKDDDFQGLLATGDYAHFDEDGFYYIDGRKSRFLKLYGIRISLDECQNYLSENLGFEVACIGNDQRMFIFTTNPNTEPYILLISNFLQLPKDIFSVQYLSQIPKTSSGKLDLKYLEENL